MKYEKTLKEMKQGVSKSRNYCSLSIIFFIMTIPTYFYYNTFIGSFLLTISIIILAYSEFHFKTKIKFVSSESNQFSNYYRNINRSLTITTIIALASILPSILFFFVSMNMNLDQIITNLFSILFIIGIFAQFVITLTVFLQINSIFSQIEYNKKELKKAGLI